MRKANERGDEEPAQVLAGRDTYVAGRDQKITHHHHEWKLASAGKTSIAVPRLEYPARGRRGIVQAVLSRPTGSVDVLCGAGGLGKSTIAQAVAAEAEARGIDVWWVSAVDESRLSAGMRALAGRLGASPERLRLAWSGHDGDAPDLVWQMLGQYRNQWLLVLDNADDLRLLTARHSRFADGTGWVRPAPPSGRVIITSRNGNDRTWGRWVKLWPVPPLSNQAAVQALRDRTGRHAGTRDEAAALSRRLAEVPLMLHQAGLFLANAMQSPPWHSGSKAVPRSFEEYRVALDNRFRELVRGPTTDRVTPARTDVTATWELSLELLAGQGLPLARPLLRLLAHFADTAVPYALVLHPRSLAASPLFGLMQQNDLQRLIDSLAELGLLTKYIPPKPADDLLSYFVEVHPLIGETMRAVAAMDEQSGEYVRLAAVGLAEAATGRDPRSPDDRPFWELISSHLERLLALEAQCGELNESTADALLSTVALCVDYAISAGFFAEADGLQAQTAPVARRLPTDHPAVLRLRYQRARLTDRRGNPASAAQAYRSVLADRARVLGEDDPETLRTMHALGWVLGRLGDLDGAEATYRKVLEGRTRVLGAMHPQTLWTRHDLAWVLAHKGSLPAATAEGEYRSILADRTTALGPTHPHTLWTRHDLAWTLRSSGDLEAAESEFRIVHIERTRLLGANHPDTMWARHELARTIELRGDLTAAEHEYVAVLDIRARTLGKEHRDTIATIDALNRLRQAIAKRGRS